MLNQGWIPVHVMTARACFYQFSRNHVYALDCASMQFDFASWMGGFKSQDDDTVHSPTLHRDHPVFRSAHDVWPLPTIVVTKSRFYVKPPPARKYERLTLRDLCRKKRNKCQLCGKVFHPDNLTIEHVLPRALGGTDAPDNLTLSCRWCNQRKAAMHPVNDYQGRELEGVGTIYRYLEIRDSIMREEWDKHLIIKKDQP